MKQLAKPLQPWPYGKLFYGSIAIMAILMLALTYFSVQANPVDDFSFTKSLAYKLSILLPIIFIWVIAARGARRFKDYAYLIRGAAEGRGMNQIANGLVLIVAYIIVLNMVGPVVTLYKDSELLMSVVGLTNHLPIFIALLASWQLLAGTMNLVRFTNSHYWNSSRIIKLVVGFVVFMIPFTINFYLNAPDLLSSNGIQRFALSAELLIFTYVLPYSLVWLLGIISAVNLFRYVEHVPGKIYKSLFQDVHKGIILVYICIFFAQLLIISPIINSNFALGLIFVYAVLILAIAGFQYIFRGARKLQIVEETI